LLLAGSGLAAVVLVAWVLLASPWLRVDRVAIVGLHRLDRESVAAIGGAEVGVPLVMVRTGILERQIRQFPVVDEVRVIRDWPSTLRIEVTERVPVAAIPSARGLRLVDREGVVLAWQRRVPRGVPVLRVDLDGGGVEALTAALAVARDMSATLRPQVRDLGADSAHRVWLTLRDGSHVEWGSDADSELKSEVLLSLRKIKKQRTASAGGWVFDVSAPRTPAVRPAGEDVHRASGAISRHAPMVIE
jgi:cell division protein FtsQ